MSPADREAFISATNGLLSGRYSENLDTWRRLALRSKEEERNDLLEVCLQVEGLGDEKQEAFLDTKKTMDYFQALLALMPGGNLDKQGASPERYAMDLYLRERDYLGSKSANAFTEFQAAKLSLEHLTSANQEKAIDALLDFVWEDLKRVEVSDDQPAYTYLSEPMEVFLSTPVCRARLVEKLKGIDDPTILEPLLNEKGLIHLLLKINQHSVLGFFKQHPDLKQVEAHLEALDQPGAAPRNAHQ